MKKYTAKDIHEGELLIVGSPFTATVSLERDDCQGAPWEEYEGHGVVSEWTTRDKKAGERVLCTDRHSRRYYDIEASTAIAKRDGWDAEPYGGTKGQKAARAVERDFEFLRSWCADEWFYAVLVVTLLDSDGEEIAREVLGGVETFDDYWREQAAEMLNALIEAQDAETNERAYWEARDTVTV